ncbi:MAG: hypothetical protein DRI24_22470 [Deltaproteobacteria bacterium]|nr:MAG: hypothetical protein DRI24_22470 [Deltaproteobacteria bacterium]
MKILPRIGLPLIFPFILFGLNAESLDLRELPSEIAEVLDLRFSSEIDDWEVKDATSYYSWLGEGRYFLVLDIWSPKSALVRKADCGEIRLLGFSSAVSEFVAKRASEVFPWSKWEADAKACFKKIKGSLVDPKSRVLDSAFFTQPETVLDSWIRTEPNRKPLSLLKSYMTDYSTKNGRNGPYVEACYVTPIGSVVKIIVAEKDGEGEDISLQKSVIEFKGSFVSPIAY